MDWFKVEARIGTNEKVDDLSDGAFRSLIHLWGYAMQHENGGKVPAHAARLIPRVTAGRLAELEQAGFIHPNGSGYVIHDWDEHQEVALQLQDKRRRDAARKKEERRQLREERDA